MSRVHDAKTKDPIMDINKWAQKTGEAVRQICLKKEAPCVGFSLVFFDALAAEEERWNFTIQLAYDPHNPPEEKERKNLEKSFEVVNEAIRRIMGGEYEDDLEDFTVRATFTGPRQVN